MMKQLLSTKKLLVAGALLAYVVFPLLIMAMHTSALPDLKQGPEKETLVKSSAGIASHSAVLLIKRYTNLDQE